jgi:hypothetical protein
LWRFALATGIGILPMTVLMVMMGDNIELMSWQGWLSLIVAAAVLWFFVRRSLRAHFVGQRDHRLSPNAGPGEPASAGLAEVDRGDRGE